MLLMQTLQKHSSLRTRGHIRVLNERYIFNLGILNAQFPKSKAHFLDAEKITHVQAYTHHVVTLNFIQASPTHFCSRVIIS